MARALDESCAKVGGVKVGQRRGGQLGRDLADHPDALGFEPQQGAGRGHDGHGDEQVGKQPEPDSCLEPPQRHDQRDGAEPDLHRGPVRGAAPRHGGPEARQKGVVNIAHAVQAQQVLHLVQHQQQACAHGEAHDDRMRDVARQVPELGQGDAQLEQPDQKCQQNGGLQAVFGRNDCHRAEHGNRDGVGGPVDELTRGVEKRADGGHDDGRVEAVFRRNPCHQRIGHGLGNRDGGHGEAGNEIRPQVAEAVAAQRVERGNVTVQGGQGHAGVCS